MSHNNNEEQLNTLLQSLMDGTDDQSMMDLLESAHKGFTLGANDFVDQATGKLSPADIKNNLRAYPLAQILISIVKYHELNKNTDIVRKTVLALLDSLENSVPPESYELQAMETTLH
ncbi:hypothetical protein [Endozoicomonas elysicola]|uniref:Uncharacterized protein n=1 Tax=Endozoicomonas elysicola TaxID=305900 RepID=A0A081K727_9GAMM|nr:hypothetical protein [Endozoicomonas elysicola]KEI69953.1 hypothetical protein GV64_03615 [Endozoicomonas elysicola]